MSSLAFSLVRTIVISDREPSPSVVTRDLVHADRCLPTSSAKKHNIRLVVKSTGHDYIGRSNAPNSLSIWTHHMKDIKTHRSFRLKGCNTTIKKPAVTVGAGTQMWDLYSALDRVNQTVVGGGGKTVSVGGYLTGAGHGLLAPTHGLGADQVIEMELVTPNGDIITANECQNEDIFWAMRGVSGPPTSPSRVHLLPTHLPRNLCPVCI